VSRIDTLKSLEVVLESFLERAVSLKAGRLNVLDGINRLDDIARSKDEAGTLQQTDLSDRIGEWFAQHSQWMEDATLRPADRNRIGQILGGIRQEFESSKQPTPATEKIRVEIGRWQSRMTVAPSQSRPTTGRKIVLRKGPESLDEAGVHPSNQDSIGLFAESLKTMAGLFADFSRDRLHLMSILDDSLKTAYLKKNREALLLSASIIYYLKQNGYMVEPFVKRLKEAERLQKRSRAGA
jgi:hypothetical protein